MSDRRPRISDAEMQVMHHLWDESPLDAAEIARRAAEPNGWSVATVKSLLSRLLAKQAITAQRQGRRYLYRPAIAREPVAAGQASRLVERLFGGRVSPLVAHLAERGELQADDLAELEDLIRKLRR